MDAYTSLAFEMLVLLDWCDQIDGRLPKKYVLNIEKHVISIGKIHENFDVAMATEKEYLKFKLDCLFCDIEESLYEVAVKLQTIDKIASCSVECDIRDLIRFHQLIVKSLD